MKTARPRMRTRLVSEIHGRRRVDEFMVAAFSRFSIMKFYTILRRRHGLEAPESNASSASVKYICLSSIRMLKLIPSEICDSSYRDITTFMNQKKTLKPASTRHCEPPSGRSCT
jgi:hypothetical protein